MNRVTKFAAAAAAMPVIALGLAGTAAAGEVSAESMHRGSTTCFNWSWADGTSTTTVYYHNVCSTTRQIDIWWNAGGGRHVLHAPKVAAGAKGHTKEDGTVESISE